MTFAVIDSHVPVWGEHPERPWPASRARSPWRRRSCSAGDERGIDRALLVSPSWEGDRNDLALDEGSAERESELIVDYSR
jgi:L-fuconolactonase